MRIASIQKVLTRVQTAVDELYKKSPDDIGLQRLRAAMLTNFGETYLAAGGAAEALAANEEALKIFQRLAEREPQNDQWQKDAAVSLNKVAEAKLRTGDAAGALQAYEDSLAVRQKLALKSHRSGSAPRRDGVAEQCRRHEAPLRRRDGRSWGVPG